MKAIHNDSSLMLPERYSAAESIALSPKSMFLYLSFRADLIFSFIANIFLSLRQKYKIFTYVVSNFIFIFDSFCLSLQKYFMIVNARKHHGYGIDSTEPEAA